MSVDHLRHRKRGDKNLPSETMTSVDAVLPLVSLFFARSGDGEVVLGENG